MQYKKKLTAWVGMFNDGVLGVTSCAPDDMAESQSTIDLQVSLA